MTQAGFWKRNDLYLVGAAIVFLGLTWSMAISYSTIPQVRLLVALLNAPAAVLGTVLHYVLQRGLRWTLRKVTRFEPRMELVLFNLPALVFMAFSIANTHISMRAENMFECFVARPIPASVRELTYGGGMINFAEPANHVLKFKIGRTDLQRLLDLGTYTQISTNEMDPSWQIVMQIKTGISFDLPEPLNIYVRTPRGEKSSYRVREFLICSSNAPTVFFFRWSH